MYYGGERISYTKVIKIEGDYVESQHKLEGKKKFFLKYLEIKMEKTNGFTCRTV